MEKLFGSVSVVDFVEGLLAANGVNTYGDIWERLLDCNHCMYREQCHKIGDALDQLHKYPTCGQIIDLLTGEIGPEDIPVKDF